MNYSTIRENPDVLSKYKSRELVELTCTGCGEKYFVPKNQILGKISQGIISNFCSNNCSRKKDPSNYATLTCQQCNTVFERLISSIGSTNSFCCQKCAATYNNLVKNSLVKLTKTFVHCKKCDAPILTGTFCDKKCEMDYRNEIIVQGVANGTATALSVKKFLLKTQGNICSSCNSSQWNNLPIPIELEHKDGNSANNNLSNCCLLCPNCHAQTSTYKGKNRGNGRHSRKTRYHEGKSY